MNVELQTSDTVAESTEKTALEILTGRKKLGKIFNKRTAGYAYLPVGSDIYEVKLMMFPRHTYFLKQNRDSIHRYTVYSKRVWENSQTKLSSPIGFGSLSRDCQNFIEIYFPLLGRVLFLDLYPKNF